jgi:CubicO group peptidase (beta-lactamase class C family)
MQYPFSFFVFIVVAVSILSCNEQQGKNENELDSFINKKGDSLYKTQKVPGIFIGVLNKGERKYYNFGYADPDKKRLFDSATIFEIGSITKTFTAYVLESVLKEKSISDSSSIIRYLPDSVQRNKTLESISFLSLLNHTSGLPRLPENLDLITHTMAPYDYYTAADLFAYLKTCTPKPDGKSNYSNLGAGLGGVLAQRISGKTYDALLNEYIFLPFKITPHPDELIAGIENKSQGYFETIKSDYWKADVLAPAGTLKCSASEMLTYFQSMSLPGSRESKQIVDKLLEPTVTIVPNVQVCRAWHTIEEKDNPIIYWHDGGTYGFSTFGAFIKEENKAVIVVVNQFNKNAVSEELGIRILKKMIQ